MEPYYVGDLVYYTEWPNFIFKVLEIEAQPVAPGQCRTRVAFHTTILNAQGKVPFKPTAIDTIAMSPQYFWDGHLFWPCPSQPKKVLDQKYPHRCPFCKAKAYVGFTDVDCEAKCHAKKKR